MHGVRPHRRNPRHAGYQGPPIESELTAAFEIEPSARPDDDSYSPGNRKAAGAEESDENAEDPEEFPDDDPASETVAVRPKQRGVNQINYFA